MPLALTRAIELGYKVIDSKFKDENAFHQFNVYLSGWVRKVKIPHEIKKNLVPVQYNEVGTVKGEFSKIISWLEILEK